MRAFVENVRTSAGLAANVLRLVTALVLLTAVFSLAASAQRITGTLRGGVSDQNGAAVAQAKISAKNQQTGVEEHTTSTTNGSYEFPTLLPGPYTLTVESQGFRQGVTTDLSVTANNVTDRN